MKQHKRLQCMHSKHTENGRNNHQKQGKLLKVTKYEGLLK
ncbi:hypothetical protein GPAL_1010 [Glaciecola pallidula DSM 14239 = ACAM 615]|uniref:Uncharacterized protein n=1 Tax=Brumicola pallidula DSM 14239 = ACAM 615 TaxID=1121922 RepID=K6Y532_9ALTE|nr:hypothetical protein GPAL_1010 [Glaciecola pallidula DSM 14239 = ACAM 615]